MPTMTKRICPFCGSMYLSTIEADIAQWAVVCDSCSATGPSASSQILASEKWNGISPDMQQSASANEVGFMR